MIGTDAMDIHEATRLARELVKDPTSRVALAITEWPLPPSAAYFAIADLIDTITHAFDEQAKPYPRFTDARPKQQVRSREEVLAILAAARAAEATPSRTIALPIRR